MPKSEGYKNLILGRGWNKGQDSRVELKCSVCYKKIKRYKSRIRSKNVFCNLKCKAEGMKKGLTAPMRKGTGAPETIKYWKRKYYKYRKIDKDNYLEMPDYSVWDLVKRLQNGKCLYCEIKEKLGLDRINNNKGHTKENTVVACELCNMTRGNRFTVGEMKKVGEVIKEIYEERKQ